jgi:EAL domain-containing protein (putative c-di-GMP-specific phosphodiesterase class I)
MRWSSPIHGNVGPDEFISIAEDTGLIHELGEWALQEACKSAAGWPSEVRLAVNVSPMQFVGDGLLTCVEAALAASGLAAERLELEITESLFLANTEHNLRTLHALKALGIRIALDDFGTGFSALSYLRRFPFDRIKIDRSFIANLSESPEAAAIVGAVVQLGRGLGMPVTAEGVETAEQLDVVQKLKCDEAQGFLFSRPLLSSGIPTLLESFRRQPSDRLLPARWPASVNRAS